MCDASRKLSRGQQDVHWLRRRGSKNSRKLLYFVEWAQECKMSASGFFFLCFFSGSGLGRITCWTRRALKITGDVFVCVRAMMHWHRDVCGHPPPHSPVMTSGGHVAPLSPAPSSSRHTGHLVPPDDGVRTEEPVTCVKSTDSVNLRPEGCYRREWR